MVDPARVTTRHPGKTLQGPSRLVVITTPNTFRDFSFDFFHYLLVASLAAVFISCFYAYKKRSSLMDTIYSSIYPKTQSINNLNFSLKNAQNWGSQPKLRRPLSTLQNVVTTCTNQLSTHHELPYTIYERHVSTPFPAIPKNRTPCLQDDATGMYPLQPTFLCLRRLNLTKLSSDQIHLAP